MIDILSESDIISDISFASDFQGNVGQRWDIFYLEMSIYDLGPRDFVWSTWKRMQFKMNWNLK